MAYNNFTTEKLFEDESINILCNRLYEALIQFESSAVVNDNVGISGTVSKIIQGAALTPIKVVPFVTDDLKIYNYGITDLVKILGATGTINYKDRVQFIFDNVYLELWYFTSIGTINTVSNLRVQATADIPAYIN